ncbi:MAG: TolC family protein [Elusimicrobiota bacterium]
MMTRPLVVGMLVLGSASYAAPGSDAPPRRLSLSLDQYADMALRQSLRVKINNTTLASADFSRQADYRTLRLPQATANLSGERSGGRATSNGPAMDLSTGTSGVTYPVSAANNAETLNLNWPVFLTGGSVGLTLGQNGSLSNTDGEVSTTYNTPMWSASYTQPLFLFTGDPSRRHWRRSELAYANAAAASRHERLAIWAQARSYYYQVLQSLAALEVEQETFKSAEIVLKTSRALVEAGRIAPVELNRAQLRYTHEQRLVSNAQTTLNQALNQLKQFVLLPAGTEVALTTKLGFPRFTISSPALLDFALQNRQDYANAKRACELADLTVKDVQETNRPLLAVTSSYGSDRLIASPGPITTNTNGWSVSGTATWLLFDSNITHLKTEQSRQDLNNAELAKENIREAISVDVTNAFLNIKNLESQLVDFDASRKLGADNLLAVRYRYSSGLDRLIDVFDAEDENHDQELEYLGVLINYHSARDQMVLTIDGPLEAVPQ